MTLPLLPVQLGLGFQMYARPDATVGFAALDDIVSAAEEACYPLQFRWYQSIDWRGHPRRSRELVHFGDAALLASRLKSNAGISFASQSLSVTPRRFDPRGYCSIRAARSEVVTLGSYPVKDLCVVRSADTSAAEVELFLDRVTWLFGACGGRFGYVHVATDDFAGSAAVGFFRGNPMGIQPLESTTEREQWLYPHREQIGELASGAYWLVFLGSSMCERLGGVAQVLCDAPVHEARALEHGAVLLRTTQLPAPLTNPTVLAAVAELEGYLEPISVPIGKYFRDFGAGGGCADGKKLWGVW